MVTALSLLTACGGNPKTTAEAEKIDYTVEQFADLQILRYRVPGFEDLSLKQKELVYYLTEAALQGRDILFDQNGKYNLTIRRMLEAVYTGYKGDKNTPDFKAMEVYLKRVWFSNGIHHHYGSEKFVPGFTPEFFRQAVQSVDAATLPLAEGQTVEQLCEEVFPVIFDPTVMPKRVNQAAGEDLVLTSACNYYDGVTQQEAEDFYNALKNPQDETPVSYGLNSRLVKEDGKIQEKVWKVGGLYGQALEKIVYWLKKAEGVAETPEQKAVIAKLMEFYETGDLKTFDEYAILWVKDLNSRIDFVNGFTESYGDPLGMKASWESLVNFKDLEAIYQPHSVKSRLSTTDSRWVERYPYLDVRLNYDRTFAEKHQISAQLLGNRTLRSQNAELPYAYQGISSRIAYNFDTRYYLEANIGYNGSENFPPKKRYGFFPSFSAGWVLSDEKFISLPSWIQLIKLRGSYGTVGNDKIGGQRWLYITEFTPGGTAMGTYQFGVSPQSVAGYNESRVGNKFVTWEKSAKGNVGFDLSLFKDNAVQFTFDYFWEKRNNILTTPGDVPDYVGITNVAPRNSGKVENKGIEAELRFNKRINKDLSIFANLQMTYARNKVLENDEPIPAFDYQDLRGYEIGYVLGYKSAGLFQDEEDIRNSPTQSFGTVVPGDIKYVDTNKDGVIDAFDRVPIKVNNVPRSMSGLSLGVTYKNFDFSMLMNASTGGTAYLYTYPSSKINLERWTAENKNARIPAAHSTTNNTVVTDHFVQNTDYIKLRNVEIGYTLPKKFLSSLRISTARIYLNGQNLAVWDKMWLKDRDPESAGGASGVGKSR